MTKPTSQILREARDLISDPKDWCRNGSGNRYLDNGGDMCSAHAIGRARGTFRNLTASEPIEVFRRAIGVGGIGNWNASHTHSEVLAAFARAIELAEAIEAEHSVPAGNVVLPARPNAADGESAQGRDAAPPETSNVSPQPALVSEPSVCDDSYLVAGHSIDTRDSGDFAGVNQRGDF